MQNGYRGRHMYLYDYENGIGYAGFEKTSIFSMNQKKGSDSRLYCKMEPNRGGRFFHAPRRIRGKPVPLIRVESDDRFDQPDRSDRDEVFRVFFEILIFFDDMCHEPEIPLDENMLGFEVSLSVFLDVILLFRRSERAGK